MNLIDQYLKSEHFLDLTDKNDKAAQDAKLEYFYKLFIDLEQRYLAKIEDMKRLDAEHKEELSHLEAVVQKVKELTEERENLTLNFKDENDELKSKIRGLERELESLQQEYELSLKNNRSKHRFKRNNDNEDEDDDDDEISSSDDELSESTIEMLIMEGFGNIVEAPNHEKIAVILADRAKLLNELNNQRKQSDFKSPSEMSFDQNKLLDQIDSLENEIQKQKSFNSKLTHQVNEFKNENEKLLKEIDELKIKLTEEDLTSSSDESTAIIAASKLEITKLKEDNANFKNEVEKLYDEIGTFEVETKQLKEENKNLKIEIEDLNNELDDLIQYKANYDRLKKEFDKLSSSLKQHEKNLNEKLNSPRKSSLTPSSSFNQPKPELFNEKASKSPQLELDWIRGENEKLLLDLEKTQTKLNDKINQYTELKQQIAQKDEEMKEFIKKYEQKETTEDDLLALQKKLLEIEEQLSQEKEEHQKDIDTAEDRQKDLLKRNDQLWSQLTKLEQSYNECLDVIREQSENIEKLELKLRENEAKLADLNDEKSNEIKRNEKLLKKNDDLDLKNKDLENKIQELKSNIKNLTDEKLNENEISRNEIDNLKKIIESQNEKIVTQDKEKFNLSMEIESLNKEKSFILNQNDNQNKKLMQDFLNLQEKYTSVNFEFNKISKEFADVNGTLKEKNDFINNLDKENNSVILNLKQEQRDKLEALEKIRQLESIIAKNNEKYNEIAEKLHRTEIQKSKLEVKSKELENLQIRFDQLNSELNDKRDVLSQVLEKNGKQEMQISNLEHQLNETKHSLIQSESIINELNHFKSDSVLKMEETIKMKHDFENEKLRREKSEQKVDEFKEEFKKLKQKYNKLQDENSELKHENIEVKTQLQGVKSKLDLIADKSHTELEKNSALQDELSETRKKLELAEIKCTTYSQKFELLMKKYETRKTKQKNKIERLWDYLQRERAKYKDLLANAQNDLTVTKNMYDKETEIKSKQESSYQQIVEEKTKLIASMADKDAKIREMKRQNIQLNSKIKLLEEETENLNEKIDLTLKERNKLRKELQMNMMPPISDILDMTNTTTSPSSSPSTQGGNQTKTNLPGDQFDSSFKSGSLNLSYWNDLNTSSAWDVNYNTGNIYKYNISKDKNLNNSSTNVNLNGKHDNNVYMRNITTDINSISSTPKSFR